MKYYDEEYDFKCKVGEGAFGQVFEVSPKRVIRYAVKVIRFDAKEDLTPDEAYKEARREYTTMRKVQGNPYIVELFGCYKSGRRQGDNGPGLAILMEYCEKGSLEKFIDRRKGSLFQKKELLRWMRQLSYAVDHIHRAGVMHRDLKPQNILVDDDDNLKISDFGFAKVMKRYYADTNLGTRYFIAPEVAESTRYSKKADIYSLGKVFICMANMDNKPWDSADQSEESRDESEELKGNSEESEDMSEESEDISEESNGDPEGSESELEGESEESEDEPEEPIHIPRRYGDDVFAVIKACIVKKPKLRPSALALKKRINKIIGEKKGTR